MSLNLLPPGETKDVKYIFLRKRVVGFVILVIIAEVSLSLFIFGMQLFMVNQYKQTKNSVILLNEDNETNDTKEAEQKIIKFNSSLIQMNEIQKNNVRWTSVVDYIVKNKAPQIGFDSFTVDDKNKRLTLKGEASTRDSFLSFKESLEKSGYFSDFNSPLSNIINPTNITFTMDFSVDVSKF